MVMEVSMDEAEQIGLAIRREFSDAIEIDYDDEGRFTIREGQGATISNGPVLTRRINEIASEAIGKDIHIDHATVQF